MTKTFKILTTISFIAMAIVLTFVGVWALTDLDFTVGGDITYTAPEPQINLQQDPSGYFYVEMGTYNNSAVRWKLVGVDGAKFTGSSAPASGTTGTFILETLIDCNALNYVFDETNYSNEYATSDIRTYLNGDYKTFLNLTDDATYNEITERSVADMYTDIGWDVASGYNSSYAKNAVYSITTSNTESDKLWLMSVAEVYTLLGGGTITDGNLSNDWSSVMALTDWDADNSSDDYYWLRSPRPVGFGDAFFVNYNGGCSYNCVDFTRAVRPAFNLEF